MTHVVIRDFDREFDPKYLITNANPVLSNGKDFSDDGVFSDKLFGTFRSFNSSSCKCGQTFGDYQLGSTCDHCHTEVVYNTLDLTKEGWIDIGCKFINPLLYPYVASIIGPSKINKIFDYKPEVDHNGNVVDIELEYPYYNIGIERFINNFEEIFNTYKVKNRKDDYKYNIVMNNLDKLFPTKFPVKHKRLRPAMIIGDNELNFDIINNYINNIISNSNVYKELSEHERTPLNTDRLMRHIQENINKVQITTIGNLSSKNGQIRSALIGNRIDYCSRMVLTPLSEEYDINDLVIPYHTALELLKPAIIYELSRLEGYNLIKCNTLIKKAQRKFSQRIYNIMKHIIKDENINVLINRNPSINFGSMILLRIKEITTDMFDFTASIHNLLLKPLGADFDGDVLNFVLIYGAEYRDWLEPYTPAMLLQDVDKGSFNGQFLPDKDTSLGLSILFAE